MKIPKTMRQYHAASPPKRLQPVYSRKPDATFWFNTVRTNRSTI